jgi:hypothetical protein
LLHPTRGPTTDRQECMISSRWSGPLRIQTHCNTSHACCPSSRPVPNLCLKKSRQLLVGTRGTSSPSLERRLLPPPPLPFDPII